MRVESASGDGPGRAPAPHVGGRRWLELVFRQVPGAVWVTDRDLKLVWVMGRLPGVPEQSDDFLGASVVDYLDSNGEPHPGIECHRRALEGHSGRFRYERAERCYEVLVEPLSSGEQIIGCVGVAVDVTARLQAEVRLAESEARLRDAQDLAHVGSWHWDITNDHVWWSDEMHRVYGLEPGTFPGTYDAFIRKVHQDDRALTERAILAALRGRAPFDFQHRIVRSDGSIRSLRTRGAVISDDAGTAKRLVGSCWDVTEQVESREALQQSVSLLRATLNSTADGLLVVDVAGRIRAVNDRFLELWQVPRRLVEDGDDDRLLSVVLEQLEDPDGFVERVQALYSVPEEESYDEIRFLDGRVFDRYSRPQRVGDEIVGRVWSFRDVSERSHLLARATFLADASRLLATLDTERALESIANLLVQTVAEACAVDLYRIDGPRRLITVCRGDEPPELAKASAAASNLPQSYRGVGRAWMSVPVISRSKLMASLRMVAPAGRSFGADDLETAIELASRVALALDNARVHEEARQALRARDEVLGVAAHEIRGPLTSMRLAIQTLRMKPPETTVQSAFNLLERESRRLSRFVEELLDAVRVRGGLLTLNLEDVDLAEVIHDVTERLAEELRRSGSRLTVVVEEPIIGMWDRDRLDQAIGNLLANAIKYGRGRPITIAVTCSDDEAIVTVADQGMGIPAEKREQLFEPFSRAVSARHYGGLGLGLYIVRTVIESLGGRVEVETEVDKGSTFRLYLPRRQGAA